MQAKCQLTCYLCQQRYGACIQCAGSSKCFLAFHPSCARSAGLVMETVEPGSDYDTSEAEPDDEPPPSCQGASQHPAGWDENQDTLNVPKPPLTAAPAKAGWGTPSLALPPAAATPGEAADPATTGRQDAGMGTPQVQDVPSGVDACKGLTALTARKRRRRGGAPMQEGTYIGGGRRMMCYCPKHNHLAQATAQASPAATQGRPPLLGHPTAAPGVPSVPVHPASSTAPALLHQQATQQQQQTRSTTAPGIHAIHDMQHQLHQHRAGCIRGVPFNHACRRGQREPDAIAAALAKRLFVAKTPYTISGAQRHARHQLALALRHASKAPLLVSGASSGPAPLLMSGASSGPAPVDSGRPQHAAKTQTQRFKEMQQTVGRRLTCGKSAIHGLGAFTKQAHAAGD